MTTTASPAPLIHLAMIAILGDIEAIAKSRENSGQGFKFRGIDDILNELHPIFRAHGVYILPGIANKTSRDAGATKSGTVITRSEVTMRYTFIASDGSSVTAEMPGEGLDSNDKATPKAVSMALKSTLIQTFLIPTADVVDADYYSPTVDARSELAARAGDRKAMQAILDQHMADAELANTEADKKRLLGLAAEMRCKIADLDVAPAPQAETTQSADTQTAEVPPAGQGNPERKTRTRKAPATPWQEVECHIGKAGGSLLGKKIGDLFRPEREEKNVESLLTHFRDKVGNLTAPSAKDAALWQAVQDGYAAWQAAQTKDKDEPVKPAQKPATTAGPTRWRDFVIESKNPKYNGRSLGDMSPDDIVHIGAYLDAIDWKKATIYQKKLKAHFDMALADLEKHVKPPEPEHTVQLRAALADSKIEIAAFLAEASRAGWIGDATTLEEIAENDAHTLLSDWKTVEANMSDALP